MTPNFSVAPKYSPDAKTVLFQGHVNKLLQATPNSKTSIKGAYKQVDFVKVILIDVDPENVDEVEQLPDPGLPPEDEN